MSVFRNVLHVLAVLFIVGLMAASPAPVRAAGVITVTTTDATVLPAPSDGSCSLREAIQAAANGGASANGDCTGGSAGTDTIAFNVAGAGVHTIQLGTYLSITTPVIIDGTTQPGYSGSPLIRIDGNGANIYGVYFETGSAGSTLKGVMVTSFAYSLVVVTGSDSTKILGNYIGTDGSSDLGGNEGVSITHSSHVIIGGPSTADRNVIAGNISDVSLYGGSTDVTIQGNYVGVLANGTVLSTGSDYGISLASLPQPNSGAPSNKIGGLGIGEGNVIAGHDISEVSIWSDDQSFSDNNLIQGNLIGTDATGAASGVSTGDGIILVNSDNTLVEGNVVSGKVVGIKANYDATYIKGGGTPAPPDATIIRSNKIGTSLNGLSAIPNGTGILLKEATDTLIGGNGTFGQRNIISGNTKAIDIQGGSGNIVDTNVLGMNALLTASLPNTTSGLSSSSPVQISRNWIANSSTGILLSGSGSISSAADNCVTGNSTFGLNNTTGSGVTFSNSWWGASTGPTHSSNPGGTGDAVSDLVTFSPFRTLAPAACVRQLLKNPSFDLDANNDKKPDNWSFANFNTATDKRDCSIHKSGTCSLKLGGNGVQKTATQTILRSGGAGDDLNFALWSKASNVPGGSVYKVQVQFYNGTTLLTTKVKTFATGTHVFQKVSGTYVAPGPYTKVVFKIFFKAASGSAWFDVASVNLAP